MKTCGIIFTIFVLFFYFSPSGVELVKEVSSPKSGGQTSSNQGQVPSDSSYGTDKCARSFSKDKPIVQYVMMIDAGSTGSRIHVYKFNNCGPSPELEDEVFMQTKKIEGQSSGLSAYADDPEAAAKSLDGLMQKAMEVVPDKLKSCSPVAVKATAGLRLVGPQKSEKVLEAVRNHLETKYPFPVVSRENNGVAIMDGSDEGVYAWITTNYLLGKIGGPDHSETAAVFDLGGGSTQIVFEPTFKGLASGGMPDKLAEGDHKYDLDFGGRKFSLYQHSHLGYGLMSARDAILATLVTDQYESNKADKSWMESPVVNPCYSAGMSKNATVKLSKDHPLGATVELTMTGPTAPAPAQCRALAERILKKDTHCKLAPCSFNGVHQPAIAKTFAKEDIYFLSYFYDRTQPLGMPESFTLREMHDLATTVCGGEEAWDLFHSVPGALEELRNRPEHCLDLNFMLALTHTGYEMPIDREVKIAKKIKGNELGWCLGARYVSPHMRETPLTPCTMVLTCYITACRYYRRLPGGSARLPRSTRKGPLLYRLARCIKTSIQCSGWLRKKAFRLSTVRLDCLVGMKGKELCVVYKIIIVWPIDSVSRDDSMCSNMQLITPCYYHGYLCYVTTALSTFGSTHGCDLQRGEGVNGSLQRHRNQAQHVLDDIRWANPMQDSLNCRQLTPPLHAPLPLGRDDLDPMQVHLPGRQLHQARRGVVQPVQRREAFGQLLKVLRRRGSHAPGDGAVHA
jgi:guanosine-diphosphatase